MRKNHLLRSIAALCLAAALILTLPVSVCAVQGNSQDLITRIINYYRYYQSDAEVNIRELLNQLEAIDPAQAETWTRIMEYWFSLDREPEVPTGVLPDGLPEDDSLCIVVMGYVLDDDGEMQDELIGRLNVVLASWEKYPNAYILCTGGPTASKKKSTTEAEEMSKWLRKKGVPADQLILESGSYSTKQNAVNSCSLLARKYPEVTTLAIITSDYHIPRSRIFFKVQAELSALSAGTEPLAIAACAAYPAKPGVTEAVSSQITGVTQLAGVSLEGLGQPELASISHISISGPAVYEANEELDLTVTAHYTNGYTRDITSSAKYSGIDFGVSGTQTLRVTYREGDQGYAASIELEILPSPTQAPTEGPAEPVSVKAAEAPETDSPSLLPLLLLIFLTALLLILLLIYQKKQKARRRRPRPKINWE